MYTSEPVTTQLPTLYMLAFDSRVREEENVTLPTLVKSLERIEFAAPSMFAVPQRVTLPPCICVADVHNSMPVRERKLFDSTSMLPPPIRRYRTERATAEE